MLRREGRPGFREHLASLARAQKSGAGVPAYMRWVNRRFARGIAAGAATIGLTPNAVTALSALLSAGGLAALLLAGVGPGTGVVVAVLLALGFVFDSADGQLARLTGRSGPEGEWLDHVVDAVRTPAIHLCVAVAIALHLPDSRALIVVALCFALLGCGQFTSQILAEQLVANTELARSARGATVNQDHARRPATEGRGRVKSFILLPTDTGVLCWIFVLWGAPSVFAVIYTALFALNLVHAAASMRRKYRKLRELGRVGVR